MKIEQYQVVIVNLDPTMGQEIKKTRPCVIVSPDEMNKHLSTVVVLPCKSTNKKYPTRVAIQIGKKKSFAAVDQIRTINKQRIYKALKKLKADEAKAIKDVIEETFVS